MKISNIVHFVEQNIGYKFQDERLLLTSLTHRSYLKEPSKPSYITEHNERLEFLGDAVLELIVTEYLYQKFGEAEGHLTALRASLVNYRIIGEVGYNLQLENVILLSKGEKEELGKARLSIVADCVEAVLGAIYLDSGYESCRNFVESFILIKLDEIISLQAYKDNKSRLQEIAQRHFKVTPRYRVIASEGKDHEKVFRVAVVINSEDWAIGEGRSKQDAETKAAGFALKKMEEQDISEN